MYVVIENTPGYLPESEPMYFAEYDDAITAVKELGAELIEQGWQQLKPNYVTPDSITYRFTCPSRMHDLGRTVTLTATDEE